ncbi:programmed cell death protein 7 [Solea solea]|uniref:programmed cell death protein 7 n=1 Tax=Solea solea TaxID=90069 RepID=UPI00272B4961|nr:programmed cell death protein 7 [Solea solea]
MDNTYQHQTPPGKPQHPVYNGTYENQYFANRPPPSTAPPESTQWTRSQQDPAAPPWNNPPGYVAHQNYGHNSTISPNTGGAGYGGPHLALPYGFDPSVPPPPFGCPPLGYFPTSVPSTNSFNGFPQHRGGPQPRHDELPSMSDFGENRQQNYDDFREPGAVYPPPPSQDHDRRPTITLSQPDNEAASEKRQDRQWLKRFLQSRSKVPKSLQTKHEPRPHHSDVPAMKDALYGAAELVLALEKSCETLKDNIENESVWTDTYQTVLNTKRDLQNKLNLLSDEEGLKRLKDKLSRAEKRRARRRRANILLRQLVKQRQEDMAEKEAAIDAWRMKKIREVEEKKKEQELKLAADSVLCEVRKKQSDVKRMQDILRSLEKLRKLRKEAASRKGIVTEPECDQAFSDRLESLRTVIQRRTTIYAVEEKALMVMLEGEQEEERRREQERRTKKERDRQLQRKRRIDAMLFGDEIPVDSFLRPFTEYYTQAQHSMHALIQIRSDWDAFLVSADHPDGSTVPQSWIIPDHPSDQNWATALQTADSD